MKFLSKMFGSRNDRLIKNFNKVVTKVNALGGDISALSDEDLSAKTPEFKERLEQGETIKSLMPEAFAVVREAGIRTLGMRHFDVQLIGGMVLHEGKIAEMKTGEGKTLVATLATYLNALPGKGVHVITVNDYLAKRDAEWMAKLYNFLGLTVGVVVAEQSQQKKKEAYAADITYGTNNEFGFDYLRDNMAFSIEEKVQRDLHYAIIDEVDSILIDEARTPLIISGPTDDMSDLYIKINKLIPRLNKQDQEETAEFTGDGDYYLDEKSKQAYLTEKGHQSIEEMLMREGILQEGDSLYSASNISMMHHLNACLRAHALYEKDVDYIVKDGEIVIVDEFTGRTMPGRRWSDGLHQAVEAKEGVKIQNENQTMASITFQNYFRLYEKLSGMTGTADTEAPEFLQIYGLEVVVIPTNKPMLRKDEGDLVYLTVQEKYRAIIEDVRDCQDRGQPVLVGTGSIESSQLLAKALKKANIKHEVLNAKQHQREASIILNAGLPGAVTIATNMAGRGTDIVLGGNVEAEIKNIKKPSEEKITELRSQWTQRHQQVLDSGGLHIIGTERHESRRVDNQLRGRSGRQGDVGSTRFYLSLEDNLMRIFASEKVSNLMQKLGMEDGEAIEHPWVSKAIENAQRKVEGHNFDMRKQVLEYDDVANDQRKIVYGQRNELMATEDISEMIESIREDVVNEVVDVYIPPKSLDELWDVPGLEEALDREYGIKVPVAWWLESDDHLHEETLRDKVVAEIVRSYKDKEELAGTSVLRHFEKAVMLQVLDGMWKDHLAAMDHLRQSINLRSYAQKNPKQEYKREAFEMFSQLLQRIKREVISIVTRVQVRAEEDVDAVDNQRRASGKMQTRHDETSLKGYADEQNEGEDHGEVPFIREGRKVGRNEPCPCGSGKKFKQCHGKVS